MFGLLDIRYLPFVFVTDTLTFQVFIRSANLHLFNTLTFAHYNTCVVLIKNNIWAKNNVVSLVLVQNTPC